MRHSKVHKNMKPNCWSNTTASMEEIRLENGKLLLPWKKEPPVRQIVTKALIGGMEIKGVAATQNKLLRSTVYHQAVAQATPPTALNSKGNGVPSTLSPCFQKSPTWSLTANVQSLSIASRFCLSARSALLCWNRFRCSSRYSNTAAGVAFSSSIITL